MRIIAGPARGLWPAAIPTGEPSQSKLPQADNLRDHQPMSVSDAPRVQEKSPRCVMHLGDTSIGHLSDCCVGQVASPRVLSCLQSGQTTSVAVATHNSIGMPIAMVRRSGHSSSEG